MGTLLGTGLWFPITSGSAGLCSAELLCPAPAGPGCDREQGTLGLPSGNLASSWDRQASVGTDAYYLNMKLRLELLGGTEGGRSDCCRSSVSGLPHQQTFPFHTFPTPTKTPETMLSVPYSGMSWPRFICPGPLWPSPATLWSPEPALRGLCSQHWLSQLWLCVLRQALNLSESCFLPG